MSYIHVLSDTFLVEHNYICTHNDAMVTISEQSLSSANATPSSHSPGRSGVRLGMGRGGDPVWAGFSDMHADWHYEDFTDATAIMDVIALLADMTSHYI